MSHELRTPLNSLLILAQQLEDNPDHNMTETQVEYASVIHSSGNELLELLNSILDLAKVESGTVTAENDGRLARASCAPPCSASSSPSPEQKGLGYSIDLAPGTPESIVTDPQRLRQILKNLLANAFKFTERGSVHVRIGLADDGWEPGRRSRSSEASSVIAFSVSDTGIGIDDEQQQRIFEAFAQGDGTTARLYGGTGLGLSISRELVGLLGGEIDVVSTPGEGSTFTVYLPDRPQPRRRRPGPQRPTAEPSATSHVTSPSTTARRRLRDARRRARAGAATAAGPRSWATGPSTGVKFLVVDDEPPQPLRDHGAARTRPAPT